MQEEALSNYPNLTKNFERCEDEPLHLIGKIQSYGFLIVLNPYSFAIDQLSTNAEDFLGIPNKELINKKIFNVINAKNAKNFSSWLHSLQIENSPFTLLFNKKLFNIAATYTKKYILLECEPFQIRDNLKQTNLIAYTNNTLQKLEFAPNTEILSQIVVDEVRQFLDYDRVMIMRFEESWNGNVVAESKTLGIRSFIHHHFPPSDIPPQARQMLLNTSLRYIADTEAEPINIEPYINPTVETSLDLEPTLLRNPSGFHLQYLRNMGVKSTLTHSIIFKGKLWGIITAHSTKGKPISFEKRQIFGLIIRYFSQQLLLKEEQQNKVLFNVYKEAVNILIDQMHEKYDIVNGLTKGMYTLLDAVEATGGGLYYNGILYLVGETPTQEHVLKILKWYSETSYRPLFKTSQLSKHIPETEELKEIASGLMICQFTQTQEVDNCLFWFKPQLIKEITWAGQPYKGLDKELSPRKSFETWTEMSLGNSKEWIGAEQEAAEALAKGCLEVQYIAKEFGKNINDTKPEHVSPKEYQLLTQELHKLQKELNQAQAFQEKLAKHISQENKALIKHLQKNKKKVSILLDKQHKVLHANVHAKKYFVDLKGRPIKKGDDITFYLPERQKENFLNNFNQALHNQNVTEEKRTITTKGEVWLEESFMAFYNNNGEIGSVTYLLTDITKKKNNQHTLENLALIAKNTNNGIILSDKYGQIEWANKAFCRITEYRIEELIGTNPEDLLRGINTDKSISKEIDNWVKNYQDFEVEVLNYSKSGKELWLKIEAQTYINHLGEEKYFTINTDITKEKKASISLKESQEKNSLLSENSHDLICLLGKQGNFIYISPSVKDILGYEPDELASGHLNSFILDTFQSKVIQQFKSVLQGKAKEIIEYKAITKRGKIIWMESIFKPIYNNVGKIEKLLATSRDITEQKIQASKIADLNNKLTSAMEIGKLAWWEWDMHQGLINYSDNIKDIVGWDKGEVGNNPKQVFSLIHPKDKIKLFRKANEENDANQYYFEVLFRLICADHSYHWVTSKVIVIQNDSYNQPIFIKGVIMDVHNWKTAQRKLKKKNKELKKINEELDHFVYSVSHDLRAPLASVMGLINVMEDINTNDALEQYFNMQLKSLEKLDGFIHDILDFSRNNRLEIAPKPILIQKLVDELLDQLIYLNNSDKINFKILIDADLSFNTDEMRLKIILSNLISNAIRFSNEHGDNPTVKLRAFKYKEALLIEIEDNGIGIEDKYLNRIYDIFFRATNKNNGSGLGLYIVKEALKRLKGNITVESEFSKWTKFTVSIPEMKSNEILG